MLNFFRKQPRNLKNDLLSGLTVSLALVPEAVAFAFVAGVDPMIGLYSAFIIGLVTSIFGGRPGMISAATGAMAVVIVGLVAMHGLEYLFPTVILCGILQLIVGFLRLGKLIRLVPHSVMLGFVNGLAVVILMAQFGSFKTLDTSGTLHYLSGVSLAVTLGLVAVTMAIIWLLPKLTRAVPATLVAILVVTGLSVAINQYGPDSLRPGEGQNAVATVQDMLLNQTRANTVGELTGEPTDDAITTAIASVQPEDVAIEGGLPIPYFLDGYDLMPEWDWETLMIIFPVALVLCGVGLIESLMTMSLIDEITETHGRGNRECIGQGLANITCGIFGGMGGCAMIGQSLINVNSGGRGRTSGITAALCLLLFILLLGPWIQMIPMAALIGVMFMVVIGTFEWTTLRTFRKVPISDVAVMLLVMGITIFMHNLALAVVAGVLVSAAVFAWQHATHLFADVKHDEFGSKIYQLHGPLFFASVTSFKELFTPADDPEDVVIDFYYTRVYDQSALEAVNQLADRYRALNKRLHLRHLSPECKQLLDRAGDLVEVNLSEDPNYHVATDRLD